MSLILQNPLSNSSHRIKLYFPNTTQLNPTKTPNFPIIHTHFQSLQTYSKYPFHNNLYFLQNHHSRRIRAYDSSFSPFEEHEAKRSKLFTFDGFLTFVESLCVVSSLVVSLCCAVNLVWFRQQNNSVLVVLGNKVLVWLLAGAVAVGSVVRRRQWSLVCGSPAKAKPGFESGNVIERIEKLEESMKSASTLLRMLSRQLEKLGIRARVTRKAMKDPISETAALAKKNSEATRALAAQEDILEKELAEVQKVLLAMQDQQQKQLDLILAIAQSGKLFESKRAPSQGAGKKLRDSNNNSRAVDGPQIQTIADQKGSTNNNIMGS